MEDFKLPETEEETPAAEQHDEERGVHRRLQPEDSERHPVAERPKSHCWYISVDEATFNLHLRAMFIVTLTFAVITVLMTEQYFGSTFPSYGYNYQGAWTWCYEQLQIKQTGILFVAKLAAVLTAGVLMKKIRTTQGDKLSRKEEMCTKSLVLHV